MLRNLKTSTKSNPGQLWKKNVIYVRTQSRKWLSSGDIEENLKLFFLNINKFSNPLADVNKSKINMSADITGTDITWIILRINKSINLKVT